MLPRLSSQLSSTQGDLEQSKSRAADLERQLADRDREIVSLQAGAGDASKLTGQLSSAQGELDQSKARVADLERQLASLQAGAGRQRQAGRRPD